MLNAIQKHYLFSLFLLARPSLGVSLLPHILWIRLGGATLLVRLIWPHHFVFYEGREFRSPSSSDVQVCSKNNFAWHLPSLSWTISIPLPMLTLGLFYPCQYHCTRQYIFDCFMLWSNDLFIPFQTFQVASISKQYYSFKNSGQS